MKLDDEILKAATLRSINPIIIKAMCIKESSLEPWATRYEGHWQWFFHPIKFARLLRATEKTERIHQMTSWGLLQVMGGVARELGYKKHLATLCIPSNGLSMGCLKMRRLLNRHGTLEKALSAYNTGRPNTRTGRKYAAHVLDIMSELEKTGAFQKKSSGKCLI